MADTDTIVDLVLLATVPAAVGISFIIYTETFGTEIQNTLLYTEIGLKLH